ncbi:MAG TPA: TIGR00159 family protein [Candidatus Omnitrophica bacterium]|nr:TIGR00159 family protein [Candidatus Omnitrophota bacterium]
MMEVKFLKSGVEIVLLWFIYYKILLFVESTRGKQVLKGLLFIIVLFLLSQWLHLQVMSWILTKLFAISVIAFIVIFQPELRRGLAKLGEYSPFGLVVGEERVLDEIVKAVYTLSKRNIGALIAIQREVNLDPFVESGVAIESVVTSELLVTIFMPHTPLHDGGVIIEGNKVKTASCLFPLTQNPNVSKTLGTRHRAALGLSEETDAVVIVVSEETGTVSLALRGELYRNLSAEELKEKLIALCSKTITKEEEKRITKDENTQQP